MDDTTTARIAWIYEPSRECGARPAAASRALMGDRGRPFPPVGGGPRRPIMASRNIVDLLVQRSAYEVFAGLGVSIAPTPYGFAGRRGSPDDLVGVVQLTLNGARASLSLCVAPKTVEGASVSLGRSSPQDCVRELANQLAGRVKNRLARYQVPLDVGLPTVLSRSAHTPGSSDFTRNLVYVFRTLNEDVQVELSNHFAKLDLVYTGTVDIAEEGDVILF